MKARPVLESFERDGVSMRKVGDPNDHAITHDTEVLEDGFWVPYFDSRYWEEKKRRIHAATVEGDIQAAFKELGRY